MEKNIIGQRHPRRGENTSKDLYSDSVRIDHVERGKKGSSMKGKKKPVSPPLNLKREGKPGHVSKNSFKGPTGKGGSAGPDGGRGRGIGSKNLGGRVEKKKVKKKNPRGLLLFRTFRVRKRRSPWEKKKEAEHKRYDWLASIQGGARKGIGGDARTGPCSNWARRRSVIRHNAARVKEAGAN